MTEFKSKFKPGDVVRCIGSFGTSLVSEGEKYTVHSVKYDATHDCTYVYISSKDFEGERCMNANRFEKEPAMKFDTSKKYRMVDTHEPVRIICTDKKDPATPYIGLRAADPDYEVVMYLYENDCRIEEVPQVDWSKVEVDTLIWAGTAPRYFQSYNQQKDQVHFWTKGTTSVTNTTGTDWAYSDECSLEKPNV